MSDHEYDNYDDSESDPYAEDSLIGDSVNASSVLAVSNKRKLSQLDLELVENDEVIKKAHQFLVDNPSLVPQLVKSGTFNWWDDDQARARKMREVEEGSNVSKTRAYIVLDPAAGTAVQTRARTKGVKIASSPLLGPIEITTKSTLASLVDAISATISCHPSNIDLASLRFRYEDPKNSQPKPFGTSELGFQSLMEAIENILPKNKSLLISLSEPTRTPCVTTLPGTALTSVTGSSSTIGFQHFTPFEQKVMITVLICGIY